jgi:ATP-dependent protease Clp ATPase subunit
MTPTCSFCGEPAPGTGRLIVGSGGIAICSDCVAKASRVLETGQAEATPISAVEPVPADDTAATCGFCTKPRDRVDGLALAGGTDAGTVTICTECLALCREILTEELG